MIAKQAATRPAADSMGLLHAALYIAAVLSANYTATWFLPIESLGFVSVGTLIFGATFTLRDKLHRRGRRFVYMVILAAAVFSVAQSLALAVPWRIVAASFTAIILSEVADTEIFQAAASRSWLTRVAMSNAVSIPLDTLLFNGLAFWGVFDTSFLIALFFGEVAVKYLIGLVVGLLYVRA